MEAVTPGQDTDSKEDDNLIDLEESREIPEEDARQRDEVVKRMLATPPKPREKPKKKPKA